VNKSALKVWDDLFRPWIPSAERRLETYQHIIHPAYTESHRSYHTDKHLEQCFNVVDRYIPYVQDLDAIVLALFFHDIVYDPTAKDNEEKSAQRLAELAAQLNVPPSVKDRACHAIMATKHKAKDPRDLDTISRYVVDVDLSIFAVGLQGDYDRYTWDVRAEYKFVPDRAFKEGRATFMEGMLQRSAIYFSDLFYSEFEETARNRIEREIGFLRRHA